MKIKLHNDGKGRSFSFEASLDGDEIGLIMADSQEEAINQLKEAVQNQIKALQKIDYTNIVYIDGLGRELNGVRRT